MSTTTPDILSKNAYFWRPGGSASQRRHNEQHHIESMRAWLSACGFGVDVRGATSLYANRALAGQAVEVFFHYSESCHHVYKRCTVQRDGKKSNLLWLVNALQKEEPVQC